MTTEQSVRVDVTRPDRGADPFAERLRAARTLRGWNPKELARRAGMATKDVLNFEDGFSKPSFDRLRRLASALQVTTDYLLGIVVAPDVEIGDALYRAVGQLGAEDRELAKGFLKVLVEYSLLRGSDKKFSAAIPADMLDLNSSSVG